MSVDRARAIADAVLYEGYALYPYRPSSLKNRQRWTFGGLCPRAHADATGADGGSIACEVLVDEARSAIVRARVRFLHVLSCAAPGRAWEESVERVVPLEVVLEHGARAVGRFAFESDDVEGGARRVAARVEGEAELVVERLREGLHRVGIRVANTTPMARPAEDARAITLDATHALLSVDAGAFVSSQDPPPHLVREIDDCSCAGLWPVLVGEPGARDRVLATPIILSDWPEIADESPLAFFDGTEIDEMLALRVLTLTDREKAEMASGDPRVAAILARTEALSPAELARLHGRLRSRRTFTPGDRVVLGAPRRDADCLDVALAGRSATVVAVEHDLEGRAHVAVTVDDDPGRDLGGEGKPGHRFYFAPEEVTPRTPGGDATAVRDEVLVAGLGNVFLGDDAFGVEVVAHLAGRAWPRGVKVVDFGVRAFDLGVALSRARTAILVDATRRGGAPGALYVVDLDVGRAAAPVLTNAHTIDPDAALASLPVAERPRVVRLVGCEPETFGPEGEGQMGLSDVVAARVDEAARMVEAQVAALLEGTPPGA